MHADRTNNWRQYGRLRLVSPLDRIKGRAASFTQLLVVIRHSVADANPLIVSIACILIIIIFTLVKSKQIYVCGADMHKGVNKTYWTASQNGKLYTTTTTIMLCVCVCVVSQIIT